MHRVCPEDLKHRIDISCVDCRMFLYYKMEYFYFFEYSESATWCREIGYENSGIVFHLEIIIKESRNENCLLFIISKNNFINLAIENSDV